MAEKVFQNLYRVDGALNKRGQSYTYLLVRKEGNILIGHQSVPSAADIREVKKLGGIAHQFICHSHHTLRDGEDKARDPHAELHAAFGGDAAPPRGGEEGGSAEDQMPTGAVRR